MIERETLNEERKHDCKRNDMVIQMTFWRYTLLLELKSLKRFWSS
jgi:hypothetical protein